MIGLKLLIMKNRREFIKKSGLTILATTLSPQLTFGSRKMLKSLFYILMICIVILNPLREEEIKD